jgi:hypothetical protein
VGKGNPIFGLVMLLFFIVPGALGTGVIWGWEYSLISIPIWTVFAYIVGKLFGEDE